MECRKLAYDLSDRRKGIIRYKNLKGEKLDEAIEKLMAEAGHEVELEEEKKEEVKKEEKDEPQVRATAA